MRPEESAVIDMSMPSLDSPVFPYLKAFSIRFMNISGAIGAFPIVPASSRMLMGMDCESRSRMSRV